MFDLVRFRPAFGLGKMRDTFDRFFNEGLPVAYRSLLRSPEMRLPVIDIIDKEDHYLVKAHVPGFKKEELDISIEGDILTLKGETKSEKEEKKENYYYKESSEGSFLRSVKLDTEIKKDGVKASLKDGILDVELPKIEAKKAQKVEIETS